MRRPTVLFACLLALACTRASVTPSPSGTSAALTAADLRTRLYIFADDSMMGREAGTQGNVKGTDYIARELRRIGLEPAGDNGTYFQTIPLVRFANATGLGAGEPRSYLQIDGGETLALGSDYVAAYSSRFPVRRGSRGRPAASTFTVDQLRGAQAIYGGVFGDTGMAATPEQAAGKVVIFTTKPDSTGERTYQRVADSLARGRWASAAALAIVQLDVVTRPVLAALRAPNFVLDRGDTVSTFTPLIISPRAAEAMLGKPLAQARPGDVGRAVSGDVVVRWLPVPAPARNVVAILRGRDPAVRGQYVAMSAHNDHTGLETRPLDHDSVRAYNRLLQLRNLEGPAAGRGPKQNVGVVVNVDSLRRLRPARPDSINNGASDDGSGSVVLLEIAEQLAARPAAERPRRSLLFIWHTAEEIGLNGSEYFSDRPTVPRDSIVAVLNMDMVGRGSAEDVPGGGPRYVQLIGARRLATELGDVIERVNAARAEPFAIDYSYDAPGHPYNRYCRSDHYMYARYGVPIAYFSLGYYIDYHQVTDEPQYIDYPHMQRVAELVRDAALTLADLDHRVVRDKPKPVLRARGRQ